MDTKTVKQLAAIMTAHGLSGLEVTEGGMSVKLTKNTAAHGASDVPAQPAAQERQPEQPDEQGLDFNEIHTVDSPMVGVFYQAPGPGRDAYVQVGSAVKAGDVLCIIEAMKLMNEITAAKDGRIVDICVSDGDVVEFGQTLFKIF